MSVEVSERMKEVSFEALSEEQSETAVESASETDAEGSADDLPLDVVFGALKNVRRRRVLRYLDEHREPVSLSDLSEHVAAIENETSPANLNSKQRKRVYVGLYQCHLPKLDDMGVITFNKSRGRIERSANASQLDKYLYTDETDTRPWHRYYMGFALLSTVTWLFWAVTGVGGRSGGVMLFFGVCLGIAGIAAFQTYDRQEAPPNFRTEIASLGREFRLKLSRSRAADSDDEKDKPPEETSSGDRPLQKCPECSEVYVSAAERECQDCETMTIATGAGQ